VNRRRLTKAAVVCAAVALPMVVAAGPASAAGLTVSNLSCETSGTSGGKTHMFCYVNVSGGNGAYFYKWTGYYAAFDGRQSPIGSGTCSRDAYYTVNVAVQDTAGHSGSASGRFFCNAIPV
jgi:hypothetical protein